MRILAISGSLRAASSNTNAIDAVRALAPTGVEVVLYKGLSDLPHFNPDFDQIELPRAVQILRSEVRNCHGIIISSPEYAHGIPGSLKNALDWLVGGFEFSGKPVALINTSPRATIALASLQEILITMSACLVPEASVAIPLLGRNINAQGIVADPELSGILSGALRSFISAIRAKPAILPD